MDRSSIITRTGDQGATLLLGGKRVSKSSVRLHAYGTVDELNAILGVVLSEEEFQGLIEVYLKDLQRILFRVGADLATPLESTADIRRISKEDIGQVELWISELEQSLPVLKRFILPSGSRLATLLHQARTVCRRAERYVVELSEKEEANRHVQVYLNRLSDFLFLAARGANKNAGASEVEV